jgi:hypothetical protein
MNVRSLRDVMYHVKIRSLLGHTRDIAMLYSHATRFVSRVLQCGCGCFSNNFSCQNTCQYFFFFLKNNF